MKIPCKDCVYFNLYAELHRVFDLRLSDPWNPGLASGYIPLCSIEDPHGGWQYRGVIELDQAKRCDSGIRG